MTKEKKYKCGLDISTDENDNTSIVCTVCKASDLGQERVPDVFISINEETPPLTNLKSMDDVDYFYERQAETLNEVLSKALPQGTYDRLLYKMMGKKLSLYRGVTNS